MRLGTAWLALTALVCAGAIVVEAVTSLAPPAVGAAWFAALDWQPGPGLFEPWRLWTCAWVHWSPAHLGVNLVGAVVVGAVGWRARLPTSAAVAWFVAWPLTHLLMAAPGSALIAQSLQHYGGLSGVLHAGVIVLGLALAWPPRESRPRAGAPPSDAGPTTLAGGHFATTRPAANEPSRLTEGPWAMTSFDDLAARRAARAQASDAHDPLAPLTAAQAVRHRWVGAGIVAGTCAKVALETPWNLALRPNAVLGIAVAPLAHACGIAAGVIAWAVVTALAWSRQPR